MPSGKPAAHDVKAVEASMALPQCLSFGCIKTYERNMMGFFRYHDGDKSQWQQMQKPIKNKHHQYLHSKMDWQILNMYDNTSPWQCAKRFWYWELSSCDVNQVMDRMLLLLTSRGKKNSSEKWGAKSPTWTQETHIHTHTHTRACHRECINCITKAMFHIFVPRDAHGTRRVWWSMLQGTIRDHGLLDDSRWSINVVWQSPWHRIPYLGKGLGKNHQDQWALKIIKGIYCLNGRPRDSINDACRNAKCWKHARTVCLTWTAYS